MSVTPETGTIPGYLAGTWKADPVHSEVAFSARHLMVTSSDPARARPPHAGG